MFDRLAAYMRSRMFFTSFEYSSSSVVHTESCSGSESSAVCKEECGPVVGP